MATYLLAWNPRYWEWSKFVEAHGVGASPKVHGWRTLNRRIRHGDRVFIVKVGQPPRGIFAAGQAKASPRLLVNPSVEEKKGWYVPIRLSRILDPNDPPIPYLELQRISPKFTWTPQGSGVRIPDRIAEALEAVWSNVSELNVTTLTKQLNEAAAAYRIGTLQQLRSRLHGKRARTQMIFSKDTIHENGEVNYAYHDGGRTELQFNVGLEVHDEHRYWRHGVAFSFQKSQTLPDPRILRPKVGLFNIWVRSNADALHGFRMWDWSLTRSTDRAPGEILEEMLEDFLRKEAFVFLGAMVPEAEMDVTQILRDFDRLYDLYEYTESNLNPGKSPPVSAPRRRVSTATHTIASRLAAQIEVDLRHNLLQESLVRMLEDEFPGCPVRPEWEVAKSGRVDVAVETHDGLLFCEIKVAPHVRAALRDAIGQLLEYAHWPTECRAKKWWIVSEGMPSADDVTYLQALRTRYGLPVFYRRIDTEMNVLGPET